MIDYELRSASARDIDLVRELKFDGLRPYVEQLWGWDPEDQEQRFRASFAPERLRIIQVGGEDVGMLHVESEQDPWRLQGSYVAAHRRSHGLGGAVVRDVMQAAAASGAGLRLRVLRPNPARALYERLGFAVVSESETHFDMEAPAPATGNAQ